MSEGGKAESGADQDGKGISFRKLEVLHSPADACMTGAAQAGGGISFMDAQGATAKGGPKEGTGEVKDIYYRAMYELCRIFLHMKEGRKFSADPVVPYIKEFVAGSIQEEGNPWMQLIYTEEKGKDVVLQTAVHSLNTTIVALKIGLGLGKKAVALDNIATLAFFHDVGMLMVSPEVIAKPGKLTSDEFSMVKRHPEQGHRLLQRLAGDYGSIAENAYQEHERIDGSGYPRGLKDGEINEHSLIVGISDMYAAMIQPRPYRPRYLPFDAIKGIIALSKGKFPHAVIRTLVNEFAVFPLGIYVKLNSKEIGKVTAVSRIAPLRPVIEILYDSSGHRLSKPRVIDMMADHVLQIEAACFTEEEMN